MASNLVASEKGLYKMFYKLLIQVLYDIFINQFFKMYVALSLDTTLQAYAHILHFIKWIIVRIILLIIK